MAFLVSSRLVAGLGVDHVFWFVILANIDQQTAGGSFENDLR